MASFAGAERKVKNIHLSKVDSSSSNKPSLKSSSYTDVVALTLLLSRWTEIMVLLFYQRLLHWVVAKFCPSFIVMKKTVAISQSDIKQLPFLWGKNSLPHQV